MLPKKLAIEKKNSRYPSVSLLDVDHRNYKHIEKENSATVRETGHVTIMGKVFVFFFFSFLFSNQGIEYNLGLNFLVGLV